MSLVQLVQLFFFKFISALFVSYFLMQYAIFFQCLGIVFCLPFLMKKITVIPFFFLTQHLFSIGMIPFADVRKSSLGRSHIQFLVSIGLLNLLVTLSIYFFFRFVLLKGPSYCNIGIAFDLFSIFSVIVSLHITSAGGGHTHSRYLDRFCSIPLAFMNLLLIAI